MSGECEQPLDELTVQVWLLYDHPNFKYCTLFVSGTELRTGRRTDRQTDGQTYDPNTRCPRRTFQAGGIKINVNEKRVKKVCSKTKVINIYDGETISSKNEVFVAAAAHGFYHYFSI